LVSENIDDLKKGRGTCWDSGKRSSDKLTNVVYEGTELKTNTVYYYRVLVWSQNDKRAVSSDPAFFHTGLLNRTDWKAKWITAGDSLGESVLLRREFVVEKEIKQAYAFVTACGYYEFYLNGKKIGDHVLDPGITDYRKTILYSTFDVTNKLKQGNNVTGAMLGNGAYAIHKVKDRYSWGGGKNLGYPCYIMQLNITYKDGSKSTLITDQSWRHGKGAVTFNNIFGGEDYDARKEIKGWCSDTFKGEGWNKVMLAKVPEGKLKSQLMPPVKVTSTINPVAELNPEPGVYLFDLGQNIVGWWRVQLKGERGQTIRVRGAETVNDSLFAQPLKVGDKLSTKFRYHSQTWSDYTLKGGETEVYEPRFFYTGFRYIEVTTSNKKNLESLNVEGRVVRSSLKRNGTFVSSDSLLNRIHRAGLWSQMGNTVSYPTDCPHREKGAYNGDGQVVAEASMHDFHMAPFYIKWLNDMRDAQQENGRIPNTSPTLVGGMGGGVAWGSAYILIPWWMHNYYSDTAILKDHYKSMKKYIGYLKELATIDENPKEPFIINSFDGYWHSLGEWCAPRQHDGPNHAVVNTFYYYYNTLLMSKIATLLGKPDDTKEFLALSNTIKSEFNKKFYNSETNLYGSEKPYQTYQLLALLGDLVPEGDRKKVFNTIVEDINNNQDGHLNTGIIGTKYLWPTLVDNDYGNLAFDVATQTTFPSFGYWLNSGATTLLEQWDAKNSHNHQMFGSITEYFYKYLGGIQSPMEGKTAVGYRSIYIKPNVPEKLKSVNVTYQTVVGEIASSWIKEDDFFTHNVSVPANSTATVVLPTFDFKDVTVLEGGTKIWESGSFIEGVSGIINVNADTEQIKIDIESGNYAFKVIRK
jgi:alpha-L-rhamnosidase